MCLSRFRRAEHQRLQPRVEDERRDGVDELHLEQLDGRTPPPAGSARSCDLAQIDLLQILIEPALGEQMALVAASSSGSRRHLRQRRGRASARARRARSRREPGRRSRACRSAAAPRRRRAGAARRPAACAPQRDVSRVHHVAIELRRPPHGLAGVVDDEVEPVVRRQQVMAEGLDARRVPQIEPEDLEPIAPLGEVRFLRVARGRIARKARGHDQVRAGAEQLDARLIADLDAPAGQHGDAAPRSAVSVRLAKLNSAHGGHIWS